MGKTLGIDRETARRIKRMSRQELDGYLSRVTDRSYDNGYEEGLVNGIALAGQALDAVLKKNEADGALTALAVEEITKAVVEAFGRIAKAIQEAGRQIVNSFSEFYKRMAEAMGSEQAKKRLRQQSIRDRKKQLERSRKRQQLAAANTDKSNNWRRLHGLCTRRKYKKHAKKN